MARKLTIGTTDLASTGARVETLWDGPLGNPSLIGQSFPVPFRYGHVDVDQTWGSREVQAGIVVTGTSVTDFHDKHRTLEQLVWSPDGPVTLKRTISLTSGDETVQCSARFIDGLTPRMESESIGRYALRFENLDGVWYATGTTDDTISTASDTFVLGGTARSRRITLTFSGVSGTQVLTNTTLGVAVTVTGDKTTHSVVLDVEDFTATQNGASVVGTVTHSGDYHWMVFAPGSNSLTLSGGGSVAISTTAAYL